MSRVTPLLCPLLVGRDDLLDLADRRLGNAAQGHGQFLLLAGEAGVGKSRFLGAVDRKAESRGFLTAWGAVSPQDRIVPGALILDLARTMLRIPAFAELGDGLLGLPQVEDGGAARSRRLLVIDMVDQIAAAIDSPAMLAFEDLQWADDLSLEILTELARRIRDRPVLLVGAYRTDDLPTGTNVREWRARLLTQRLAEEAQLAPLTLESTALMTTLILDTGLPAPRAVVSAIYDRTDGIPLHIEELLGALGDDARSDGSAIRDATVPATIEDAVLARFERLSPDARAVAQAGAVIGRCFVPEVLAGIMDLPTNALDAPLEELLGQSFLEPPGSRGLFDFRHQLLRDALYRTIPPATLRRLHARAGEFGAQLEGASEIHASVHFECAGLRGEAFRAALSGARAAAKVSSHREALELYERAVRNLPPDLDEAEQAEILEAFSEEAAANDENEVAERIAADALERFLAAGRPIDAARVRGAMAWFWRRLGRPVSDRIELVEAGLAELAGTESSVTGDEVRALLLTTLARMQLDAMAVDEARRIALEGQIVATAVGDAETVLGARAILGAADALTGDVEGGFTKMGAAAREGRPYRFAGALSAYRDVAAMAARHMQYRQSEAWLQEGIAYASTIDQWHCRYNMTATLSLVAWSDARWDEAVAVAGQVLADRRGGVAAETIAHAALGYVAFGRGDLARARELLERSLSAGMPSGEVTRTLPAMWGLAETDLADGDAAAAIRRCEEALDTGVRTGERALVAPFLVTGVRAYLAAGRPEDAERWVTRGSTFLATLLTVAQPAFDHGRGLVRLAAGSTGGAREALEAAVNGWDQRNRIWESTWARLDLASCLVRSNRYADAAALVATARATATRLDSAPLLARADELARVGRGRGTFEEPWHPLTAREFEVARLIADGMTNAEIGGELSISPKTASAHVEHILGKLGVARRAEIAAWAANVAGSTNGSATTDRPVLARR